MWKLMAVKRVEEGGRKGVGRRVVERRGGVEDRGRVVDGCGGR